MYTGELPNSNTTAQTSRLPKSLYQPISTKYQPIFEISLSESEENL